MNFLIHDFIPIPKRSVIMRINLLVLFIVGVFLQVSASSYGQKITLSINNKKLVHVFRDIQSQSGYDFIYSNRLIKMASNVSINVKDVSLQEVLDACFKGQPFTYVITDKTIVIREKKPVYNVNS